jgi:hypothetical protein
VKVILTVALFGLITASILGQDKPVKIMLASTSSTPAAFLLDNSPKVGCPNLSIVLEESKADYVLEAQGGL